MQIYLQKCISMFIEGRGRRDGMSKSIGLAKHYLK